VADEIIRLEAVTKAYNTGLPSQTQVLHGVDLTIHRGDFVALMGPSGSGKSTLLNIIGLLDRPTSGRLSIHDTDTGALDDVGITRLRGRTIGFVFQSHMLISAFTATENVMMPMVIDRGFPSSEIEARARGLLDEVGLSAVADNLAPNMSGGQQQRVAIARALAMNPDLVLADEPTGNLDTKSAADIFALMRRVNAAAGASFLIVTHNIELAKRCDRIVEVIDGRITQYGNAGRKGAMA
jgi:lipoprotein-releasing system ATP-binding protein